jgi:hypothetical protein
MSDTRPDLSTLVGDLTRSVRELQSELDTERRGPPTPADLVRFTSEVTIPAIILALETNIRALELLRRALRLAEGREPSGSGPSAARSRAEDLGRATLSRLDSVLADLQEGLAGRPDDDEARELLAEARELRAEIDERLAGNESQQAADPVSIDVDAELRSIKDELDEDGSDDND